MEYDGILPQHGPLGKGTGTMPGRVAWAHDPQAVAWNGGNPWWNPENYDEGRVLAMVRRAVESVGGTGSASESWREILGANADGLRVAIKCNMNGSGAFDDSHTGETDLSYTNPVLLKCLLRSLVEDAGVVAANVTVFDVSRIFPDYMVSLCTEGSLSGVRFVGRDGVEPDEDAPVTWSGDVSGPRCYLPTCLTEADRLINLASLKGHSYGITLCGKNHFGSFFNGDTFRPPQTAGLHGVVSSPAIGSYSPLVDFMADPRVGGKTALYLLDALVCATSEGAAVTREAALWQQSPFDGSFTASVIASQDPVAIDSVGADLLTNEPAVTSRNAAVARAGVEGYLHEAARVASPPSGTDYGIGNLGVHEHWDNAHDKRYSRNRGEDEGIELVYLTVEA